MKVYVVENGYDTIGVIGVFKKREDAFDCGSKAIKEDTACAGLLYVTGWELGAARPDEFWLSKDDLEGGISFVLR